MFQLQHYPIPSQCERSTKYITEVLEHIKSVTNTADQSHFSRQVPKKFTVRNTHQPFRPTPACFFSFKKRYAAERSENYAHLHLYHAAGFVNEARISTLVIFFMSFFLSCLPNFSIMQLSFSTVC